MKHILNSFLLITLALILLSCSDGPINKIIIDNKAAGDIYLSFRGSEIAVASGETIEIENIDKGEYEYETVFSIPAGATEFSSDGEMSGTFNLRAGTKILVIYTSVFDQEGTYTIYASVTSSDDVNWEEINPINP
ncbi:MAG: hypothetical protein HXY48_14255 [Ignavibacteriaceae bacterium]|jgi:hypothetical protein|nr:hypothetical protein [Ignavibacteriaceae bacterium]